MLYSPRSAERSATSLATYCCESPISRGSSEEFIRGINASEARSDLRPRILKTTAVPLILQRDCGARGFPVQQATTCTEPCMP